MALLVALSACGQKGPLYLPGQSGVAAKPVAGSASAPRAGRAAAPLAPVQGASAPGLPPAAQ